MTCPNPDCIKSFDEAYAAYEAKRYACLWRMARILWAIFALIYIVHLLMTGGALYSNAYDGYSYSFFGGTESNNCFNGRYNSEYNT